MFTPQYTAYPSANQFFLALHGHISYCFCRTGPRIVFQPAFACMRRANKLSCVAETTYHDLGIAEERVLSDIFPHSIHRARGIGRGPLIIQSYELLLL